MKKEFYINITFLIVLNLLIKPIYLLWIDIEVQNRVGYSDYGLYLSLFSICYIFQFFADPGLFNYNVTLISQNRHRLSQYIGEITALKITLAVLYLLIIAVFSQIMSYSVEAISIIKWVSANILLISFIQYFRSNISAMGCYRWDSFFSVLDKLMLVLLCTYLLYFHSQKELFDIYWFIYAHTAVYVLSLICVFVFVRIRLTKIRLVFQRKIFVDILKKCLPYAGILFLMTIYTRIDSFMLERMIDDNAYQAGIYASAFRLFDAGNAFLYIFGMLLLPMYSNLLVKDREKLKELFYGSLDIMWVIIVSSVTIAIIWSEEIMKFFYYKEFISDQKTLLTILMISLFSLALSYIFGTFLLAFGALKKLNMIVFVGVILNIVLNVILIQRFQSIGAAIASAFTQLLILILQVYYCYIILQFRYNRVRIGKYALYVIGVGLIALLLKTDLRMNFWFNIIISMILCIILAFVTNILSLPKIKRIISRGLARMEI